MLLTIEATYENGVLNPAEPLPLKDHQRVQITVQLPPDIEAALAAVQRGYGLLGWTGDPKMVEHVALTPEFGVREAP